MKTDLLHFMVGAVLAVSSWLQPQPQLSEGLLVVYGGQQILMANNTWHWPGTNLDDTGGCALASISPAHLGQLAYVSVDLNNWIGPCRVVDVQGRDDALDSIFRRHEVAEVSYATAKALGFSHGHFGYIWFGACPPPRDREPQPYQPPYAVDNPPYDWTPSLYPYPARQPVIQCHLLSRSDQ